MKLRRSTFTTFWSGSISNYCILWSQCYKHILIILYWIKALGLVQTSHQGLQHLPLSTMVVVTFILGGAAIAQWICLLLPSCCPASSPKHVIYTFIIYSQICAILSCEKNKNKQKEVWFGPFLKCSDQGL